MAAIQHLIRQYELLTYWYSSVLNDIKDEEGKATLNNNTNSLEWIAGHLNAGRYRNITRLGIVLAPYPHLDKYINQALPPPNAVAFSREIQYPSLTESRQLWKEYSEVFLERLKVIDDSVLKTEIPFTIPIGGNTVEDALIFLVLHETYHIGQMSIMRKALGYPGMQLRPAAK